MVDNESFARLHQEVGFGYRHVRQAKPGSLGK
jgi:hypothetical protein